MTVRVLAVGDPAVYGYTDPASGLLTRFHELTGIDIWFDILPWDRYLDTLATEARAAEPRYDIVMIAGHLWLAEYAAAGLLQSLEPFEPFAAADWQADDILSGVDAELRFRGERFLVPSFSDGHILYAHTELDGLIDEASGAVDVSRLATVAGGLVEAGRMPAGMVAPLVLKAAPSEIFLDWLPYLRTFGGEFLHPDGTPAFDSAEGRAALEYYLSLKRFIAPRHAPYGNEEVARALRSGEVAFGVSWGGQAGVIVPDDGPLRDRLRYAPLTHPWNVTWSFGLLAASHHPQEAAAALAWLSGSEADRVVGVRAGSPCRRATYVEPDLRRRCPWFPAQEALMERAVPLPALPDLGERMGPMYEALASAFSGEVSPADALARAAATIGGLAGKTT